MNCFFPVRSWPSSTTYKPTTATLVWWSRSSKQNEAGCSNCTVSLGDVPVLFWTAPVARFKQKPGSLAILYLLFQYIPPPLPRPYSGLDGDSRTQFNSPTGEKCQTSLAPDTPALVQLPEHPEVPVPHLGALRMPISVSGMFLLLSISPSATPFTPAAYTHSSNSSFPETSGNHPLMFPYCTTYMLPSPPISQL